jgi:hypothetical protein
MSTAGKFLDILINSSVYVALAVVSLAIVTSLHFNIPPDKNLLIFIFFGTVTAYNFVKYAVILKLNHSRRTESLRIIRVISLFSLFGLVISAFFVSIEVLLWAAFLGLLTSFYALPILSRRRNLRSVSGLKIFLIALVWSGVTVILPLIDYGNVIFETSGIEFVQRSLLVLVWILPFEIRDLKYDLEELGTLPQRVGITGTKILGLVFLLVVLCLEMIKDISTRESTLALVFIAFITAGFVWKSKENQSRYFSAFWVEGIPVLWLLVLLFFRSL